ncbi:MAG: hypothetical protein R3A44_24755 [Caldilineaceae bacterium]
MNKEATAQPACPLLYRQSYVEKGAERTDLFRKLAERYGVRRALYPGCYVDISPSFVISNVVYIDNFRKTKPFFADPATLAYINACKEYAEDASVTFHFANYESEFREKPGSFDLLISQYAGFISTPCQKYLRPGGLLLVNDSHGDASMANLDPAFRLVAVANHRGNKFSISEEGLDRYFAPKKNIEISADYLRRNGKGIAYTKWAGNYIFQKVG